MRILLALALLLVPLVAHAQTPVSFPMSRLEWTPPPGVIPTNVANAVYGFRVYIDTTYVASPTTCTATVVVPPAMSVVTCGADGLFTTLKPGAHNVRVSTTYLGLEGAQSVPLNFTHSDQPLPAPPSNLRFSAIALVGMLDGKPFQVAFTPQ